MEKNFVIDDISEFCYIYIVFNDSCFSNLIRLTELHIQVSQLQFHTSVFTGLENVTLLDLTNSTGLKQQELEKCFAPGIFPNLKKLILCKTGIRTKGYSLDKHFWKSVNQRPISYLDISHMYLAMVDAQAFEKYFDNFQTIIARGAYIGSLASNSKYMNPIPNLKYLDIRDIITSSNVLCATPVVSFNSPVTLNTDYYGYLANVETILLDNICQSLTTQIKHHFYAPYIRFSSNYAFHFTNVSLNRNNIAYADIHMFCENPTLKALSLESNEMEYLSPAALSCLHTLQYLDFTDNKLGLMMTKNETSFASLLGGLHNLRGLSLAKNQLKSLPERFFESNILLLNIDLTGNALYQVHFNMQWQSRLKKLNIAKNAIRNLDEKSRCNLDNLLSVSNTSLDLTENPLRCSTCDHLNSISWLWLNRVRIVNIEGLTCTDENEKQVAINQHVVTRLQMKCDKPKVIALWTSFGGALIATVVLLIILIKRRLARRIKGQILRKIRDQEHGFEYVVYLSYCSEEEDIVSNFVADPLENQLKEDIQVERELVCIGDKHFRVGFHTVEEIRRCLKMSALAIIIVTDNFLDSPYCMLEFRQALHLEKPVILMVKEGTSIDRMSDEIKQMFEMKTRLVWKSNADICFVLKTTWANVCNSILNMLIENC